MKHIVIRSSRNRTDKRCYLSETTDETIKQIKERLRETRPDLKGYWVEINNDDGEYYKPFNIS